MCVCAPHDARLFDANFPLHGYCQSKGVCTYVSVFGSSMCGLFGFGRVQKHSNYTSNVQHGCGDSLKIRGEEEEQQQQRTE